MTMYHLTMHIDAICELLLSLGMLVLMLVGAYVLVRIAHAELSTQKKRGK